MTEPRDDLFSLLADACPSDTPYPDAQALADDLLRLTGILCLVYTELRESIDTPYALRGMTVPAGDILAALQARSAPPMPIEPMPEAVQAAAHIRARTRASQGAGISLPFAAIAERFALSDFEAFCLLLALCPDLDRRFEQVFAALQGDPQAARATLGLAADLFSLLAPVGQDEIYGMLDRQRPVNALLLTDWQEDASRSALARPLAVPRQLLYELTGVRDAGIDDLNGQTRVLSGGDAPVLWHERQIAAGAAFLDDALQPQDGARTGVLLLFGPSGCGRSFALAQMARQADLRACEIDIEALSGDTSGELLRRFALRCLLDGCIPCLNHIPVDDAAGRALALRALRQLQRFFPVVVLSADKPWNLPHEAGTDFQSVELPLPDVRERHALWDYFGREAGVAFSESDLDALAGRYRLSAAEIRTLSRTIARDAAHHDGTPPLLQLVADALRQQARSRLGGLAQHLRSPFTWDDLQVPDEAAHMLRSACTRIQYLYQVNENWGFSRRLPYGQGISVLLYGPPGTGKSMAAQVLAREVGIDLFRVDLSQIVDKYIGETEKNLGRLFDTADGVNCILFFDEADALFSKRTEVGDSKDKYANVETAYLLQRIEQFPGITILATNNARNFDEAFRRRMTYYINIPMPDRDTRERIWRSVFPPELPVDRGVNFTELADKFEFAGSNIKSVAISAAYAAAAAGTPVTRHCIQQALQIEYLKTGKLLALSDYPG